MRPYFVARLEESLGTGAFGWLVPTPALLYVTATLLVLYLFVQRSRIGGLSRYDALTGAIWAMIGGLIGARLLHLILRAPEVVADPISLLDPRGGTISWGAYLGGMLGFWLYFARRRIAVAPYADVAGSVFGLGPFIGRFACLLNGDDYGRVTDVAWGIEYPHGSYAFVTHVRAGLLDPLAETSLSVHPVQLYLATNALVIFLICSWAWKNARLPAGAVWFLYWALYGLSRFGFEFFRGDVNRTTIAGMPDAQAIALVIGVVSLGVVLAKLRGWRPEPHGDGAR